jgi:hypothetical protein
MGNRFPDYKILPIIPPFLSLKFDLGQKSTFFEAKNEGLGKRPFLRNSSGELEQKSPA